MPTSSVTLDPPKARVGARAPLRVALIIGSTREDRFGPVPAAWAAERARDRRDVELDVIDLADEPLPVVLMGNDDNAPVPSVVAELAQRLDAADAFVIVTPVYNRGYPASLKNAIDWFHSEWEAKPVGFISYGGRTGGIEAVEQLRTVFVELGAMTIRNVLSFPEFWTRFDDEGQPTDPTSMAGAATAFYDQLLWWARALANARAEVTS